jgi:hypothetical protein
MIQTEKAALVLPINEIQMFQRSWISMAPPGANLSSTTLNTGAPSNQRTPVTTNVLSGGSNFTLATTNAVFANARQQFYILSTTNN